MGESASPVKKSNKKLPTRANSQPELPRFVPPPLPRCAEIALPGHYEEWKKKQVRLRKTLKEEEAERLNHLGFKGDVQSFKAFLSHKFGSLCRGWREGVAPDEVGLDPVLPSDLNMACRKLGFTGNIKSLWKALSKNNKLESIRLWDFDPQLAHALDLLCREIFQAYSGGAQEAWQVIERDNLCRINYREFVEFLEDQEMIPQFPDKFGISPRRLFDALDMSGLGTVSEEEFRFIDHWAHKKWHIPLPPSIHVDPRDLPEPEHWSPPPPEEPKEPGILEFRKWLENKFGGEGGAARAWRIALDLKGVGAPSISDFGKGCRAIGWKHEHGIMFNLLKKAGDGIATLRALDPATCKAIDSFCEESASRHGSLPFVWEEVLDPGGTGTCSKVEFVKLVTESLGLSKSSAKRIFTSLDTAGTGWVSESEMAWLETFESKQADNRHAAAVLDEKHENSMNQAFPFAATTSNDAFASSKASTGIASGSINKTPLVTGSLGEFELPWKETAGGPVSSKELSPLGRDLWAPHRSSRSFHYRALANTHTLKHRWLASAAEDRFIYNRHLIDAAAWAQRSGGGEAEQ